MVIGVSTYLIQKHTDLPQNADMVINGLSFPLTVLAGIGEMIAIFVIILVADMITDEYVTGTLKLNLLHPVSRTRFWFAKALSLLLAIGILLGFTLGSSLVIGTIIGGIGDSLKIAGHTFSPIPGLLATSAAFFSTAIPLWSYALLVMFFAIHLTSTGSVIGVGMGLYFFMAILGQVWGAGRPYLLNTYINIYGYVFTGQWKQVITGVLVILLYGGLGYLLGLYSFKRKDLLY